MPKFRMLQTWRFRQTAEYTPKGQECDPCSVIYTGWTQCEHLFFLTEGQKETSGSSCVNQFTKVGVGTLHLPLRARETLANVLGRWREKDTNGFSDYVRTGLAKCLAVPVGLEILLKSKTFFFFNCNRGKTFKSSRYNSYIWDGFSCATPASFSFLFLLLCIFVYVQASSLKHVYLNLTAGSFAKLNQTNSPITALFCIFSGDCIIRNILFEILINFRLKFLRFLTD